MITGENKLGGKTTLPRGFQFLDRDETGRKYLAQALEIASRGLKATVRYNGHVVTIKPSTSGPILAK